MESQKTCNDKILIERIQGEDVEAFKTLFELYYEKLCHFVHLIIDDKSSVEEVVQDMFVNFWETRDKINITTSVKSYLYASCKNKALNMLKKKANNNLSIEAGNYEGLPTAITPEEVLAYKELDDEFQGAIESLPGQAKRVFLLRHFQRAKQKEIASMMNISESTVEKHMGYALRHLRKNLEIYRNN